LTKLRNDELPSVKAADLVNYVALPSVYTGTNSSYIIPFNHWPRIKWFAEPTIGKHVNAEQNHNPNPDHNSIYQLAAWLSG